MFIVQGIYIKSTIYVLLIINKVFKSFNPLDLDQILRIIVETYLTLMKSLCMKLSATLNP
jgi:hypothetical protein